MDNITKRLSPRTYILDYLLENNIYAEDFADDLGITVNELTLILSGKEEISTELAKKIAKETGLNIEILNKNK